MIFGAAYAQPSGATERIGQVRQPLVNGALVDEDVQRTLGLVTVNGRCSGVLLNQSWVLTARHCVTIDRTVGGFLAEPSTIAVTATWTSLVGTGQRIRDFSAAAPGSSASSVVLDVPDIALLDLGRRHLGHRSGQHDLLARRLLPDDVVTQFGRGFATLATGSWPTTVAAVPDGLYRRGDFNPSNIGERSYEFALNAQNQVGHGGDSGGPGFVRQTPSSPQLSVTGVASNCAYPASAYAGPPITPATPFSWRWVTAMTSCEYVSVEGFRSAILESIRSLPIACLGKTAACTVAEATSLTMMLR